MDRERWIGGALASVVLLCAAHAHAHIKLLQPASWLNEDELGGPQKGSPCGPGNARPLFGDDVQPIPASDAVTTFRAGETITVQWQETVYHPGYFRIAIAKVRAADATSADFPDPALTDTVDCHYDRAAVQTGAHDNVLADGLFMADEPDATGMNRSLMHEVTLPDEPCEECTLQIVQVMEGHPGSSCFYFHCADIEILPADDGSGRAGMTGGGADAGSPDAGDPTPPASSNESGGCSVARAGARSSTAAAACLLGIVAVFSRRRRSRPRVTSRPRRL